MKDQYFQSVVMIEKLHRLFLDVIKLHLDRMNARDINNVQCLVLYNIGKEEVTVGELTNRGYYLGSNVSYNLRKMIANGYLVQEPSAHDKRSSHVKLSTKGIKLYGKLDDLFLSHSESLNDEGCDEASITNLKNVLEILEQFWNGIISKGR